MKKSLLVLLVLALALPGCGNRKKDKKTVETAVDTQLPERSITSFFNEELEEFANFDDESMDQMMVTQADTNVDTDLNSQDFEWVEEDSEKNSFETILFGFNKASIREDQKDAMDQNIKLAKEIIKEHEKIGDKTPLTIVVEGHADNAKGTKAYNMTISERRAKAMANQMVKAGVPEECLKVVGRGCSFPAVMDGKEVSGDWQKQWPNRRGEIRAIYA